MITLLTLALLCVIMIVGTSLLRRDTAVAKAIGVSICVVGLIIAWGLLDPDIRAMIQTAWDNLAKAFQEGGNELPRRK